MNIYKQLHTILHIAFLSVTIFACTDKFDDHVAVTDPIVNDNLFEQLTKNSNVSEFNKLLVKSGYDKVLEASKTYTVFAPSNTAIAALDPAIVNDDARLKYFVANHIAISAFRTDMASDSLTVKMLTGKNLIFLQSKIDEVDISTPNKFASNGIFHIIDGLLNPKLSIWEYLKANNTTYEQAAFITALDTVNIYPNGAGNTGNVLADNEFTRETFNIRNEEGKYTLFLMQNAALNAEVTKLLPYLSRPSADTTKLISTEYALRDMVFAGELKVANLPDTLISKFGVKVPINRGNIVQTIKSSNGLIHIVSSMNVNLIHRLVTTKIEGENPRQFIPGDKRGNIFYRQKLDNNGIEFKDLMVQNHAISQFLVNYTTPILYSTQYKVSWRAINDIQSNTFQQKLLVGTVSQATTGGLYTGSIMSFPYTTVSVKDYVDINLIGTFTLTAAGSVPLTLVGANNNATTGTNTLSLDYIKLVPIIK